MPGTYKKRGNSYVLEFMCKGQRYSKSIKCSEVKNEKEIKMILSDFVLSIQKGTFTNTNYNFYEFSTLWLQKVIKPSCSPSTLKEHVINLNNRIIPFLGKYKLTDINRVLIQDFVNFLKTEKTRFKNRENRPISKETILKNFNIVRAVLQYAFELDLISVNPCSKVKLKLNNIESELTKETSIHYYDKETYLKVLELLKKEDPNKRIVIETALKTRASQK